jgi:ribonuclease HI
MLVTLWAIWHAKRKAVHEEIFQSPMATIDFVNKFLGDLGETSSQGERARFRTQPKTGRKKWLAPPVGRSTINVDVAVAKSTLKGAMGVVCRTLEGAFIGAAATVYVGLTDPWCLEALACREALDTAADLLLGPIHVASDCLKVIHGLKGDYRGRFRNILKEISDRAIERGDTFFVHKGRESNGEAHRLARFASSLPGGRYVWWDQPPDGLDIPVIFVEV